jgi:hypothetical protein
MNSKEYIKTGLQRLVNLYPQLTFIYQFDEIESMHMVQVEPQDEFESNKAYQVDEADLTFDFDNSFFPESIVFISKDSLIKVDSPEFILKNFTPFRIEDFLLNYSYNGIKDKEYQSGENNYALAA